MAQTRTCCVWKDRTPVVDPHRMVIGLRGKLSLDERLRLYDDGIIQWEVYILNLERIWWADSSASFDYLLAANRDSSPSVCLYFIRHCLKSGVFGCR